MKRKALLAALALALAGCSSFEGNGMSFGLEWVEPNTGAKVEWRTAK